MFFTQDDYKKIQQWLTKNSVKDTEFSEANIPFNGEETITIVQGNQNKKVFLKDLIAQVFNLGISDFVNITDKYDAPNISLEEAIKLIPSRARKKGQVITFLDREDHWHIYQFKGVLNQWNVLDTWEDLFDWEKLIIDSILPDEEDLTKSPADANGNSYLSLKDREYNPEDFSGLGRIILRKNIVEIEDPIYGKVKKNILYQDMLTQSNTIYEIRYDFDLNGQEITIPEGCVLDFQGGSLSNCNNIILNANCKILGNYSTIILNKGSILLGYKSYIDNINIETDSDNTILKTTLEHIEKTKDISSDDGHNAKILLLNINIKSTINNYSANNNAVIKFISEGNGFGYWGITVKNINIYGKWKIGIEVNTNRLSGTDNSWLTDIYFERVTFNKVKNPILIDKINYDNTIDGNVPERITFFKCSAQSDKNSSHWAIINAGKRITFVECEPWDWHVYTSISRYLVNPNRVESWSIQGENKENCVTYSEPFSRTNLSILRGKVDNLDYIGYGNYGGSVTDFLDFEKDSFTIGYLENLIPGVYIVPSNSKYGENLGIDTTGGGIITVANTQSNTRIYTWYPYGNSRGSVKQIIAYQWNNSVNDTTIITPNVWKSLGHSMSNLNLKPSLGELWFDTYDNCLKIKKENNWVGVNGEHGFRHIGTNSNRPGLEGYNGVFVFYNETNERFQFWNGTNWVSPDNFPIDGKYNGTTEERPNVSYYQQGVQYYDRTIGIPVFWNGNFWINSLGTIAKRTRGTTYNRPTFTEDELSYSQGLQYFDTTLNKPIWWTGEKWVDATGADV